MLGKQRFCGGAWFGCEWRRGLLSHIHHYTLFVITHLHLRLWSNCQSNCSQLVWIVCSFKQLYQSYVVCLYLFITAHTQPLYVCVTQFTTQFILMWTLIASHCSHRMVLMFQFFHMMRQPTFASLSLGMCGLIPFSKFHSCHTTIITPYQLTSTQLTHVLRYHSHIF